MLGAILVGIKRSLASFVLCGILIAWMPVLPVILNGWPNHAYAASIATIYKVQSGLIASDSLTTGDTSGWEFNGSAVGLNAPHSESEDSSGLHLGLLAPSANTWAGYFGITPLTPAHLFHARITLGDARPTTGVLDTAVYVKQEMFQDPRIDAMGCGADMFPTETHWTISLQAGDADHEIINQSVYTDPSANQPTSRECTLITNGDNMLTAYIDGKKVFSSNQMNLNMPQPFQYYVELQTNSVTPSTGQMFTGTFNDYYATTSDSIKVENAGSGSLVRVVDASSGNVLSSSAADSTGTALVDVGGYHMPINANVVVYDSTGTSVLASTSAPAGIYGGDVFNVGSSVIQSAKLAVNSVDLSGTDQITGLYTTISKGLANAFTGFTPVTYDGTQDTIYIVDVRNYGTHIFDHWEDGNKVRARVITPTTSTAAMTASYRETSDPQPPISLTSLTQYTTRINTPTIIGTGNASLSIQLFDGSTPIGNPVIPSATNGQWSITTPTLSDGRHVLSARATDPSTGSISTFSSPITMTIDTVIPSLAVTSNTVSSDGRITLTGTAFDPGSGIKLVEVQTDSTAAPFVSATPTTAGDWSAWSFTTTSLGPGVHQLTIRATDMAGNIATTTQQVTISTNTNGTPDNTSITLQNIIINNLPWGKAISVTGTLRDTTTGNAISGATITFTGSGAGGLPATVTTSSTGTFVANGPSPSTVGAWQVIAHYAGDSMHSSSDSNTITYSTFPHSLSLSLSISPSPVKARQTYDVSGSLADTDAGNTAVASATITFTAKSPITIPSTTTTNSNGNYLVNGLTAPAAKGSYSITASFAGNSLYNPATSPTKTLKVT